MAKNSTIKVSAHRRKLSNGGGTISDHDVIVVRRGDGYVTLPDPNHVPRRPTFSSAEVEKAFQALGKVRNHG